MDLDAKERALDARHASPKKTRAYCFVRHNDEGCGATKQMDLLAKPSRLLVFLGYHRIIVYTLHGREPEKIHPVRKGMTPYGKELAWVIQNIFLKQASIGKIGDLCGDALKSRITQLIKVGKTLSAYRTGLLNYFRHHITSTVMKGINNKIKTLKRMAYGFRDTEYFKLRLYHLHTRGTHYPDEP